VDINHPDQYYTITKEKGKKMPRSWKEAVVVFSLVSIEIFLSSKALLAYMYSAGKGIVVFV
jgi:hypothetical protein